LLADQTYHSAVEIGGRAWWQGNTRL